PELLLIVLGIIVLFGPKKIPEVAQMISKGIKKVRTAQAQFKEQIEEIQTELEVVKDPDKPVRKNPPIREINASELKAEHFSNNPEKPEKPHIEKEQTTSIDVNKEPENKPEDLPDSRTHGFEPLNPDKSIEDFYDLKKPENDDENSAEDHLDGTSHGLQD
ncbi:twin-arginine translocase TatA/TatE family subunit, partial [Bacteroidota bacterium]